MGYLHSETGLSCPRFSKIDIECRKQAFFFPLLIPQYMLWPADQNVLHVTVKA